MRVYISYEDYHKYDGIVSFVSMKKLCFAFAVLEDYLSKYNNNIHIFYQTF